MISESLRFFQGTPAHACAMCTRPFLKGSGYEATLCTASSFHVLYFGVTGHITSLEIVLSHTHFVSITPKKMTRTSIIRPQALGSNVCGLEGSTVYIFFSRRACPLTLQCRHVAPLPFLQQHHCSYYLIFLTTIILLTQYLKKSMYVMQFFASSS